MLAISEHTRRDAIERLGVDAERVAHIGSGPSTRADAAARAALPPGVHRPFVLTVTGWGEPRKDPHTTFAAFAALPDDVRTHHQLVVVCAVPEDGVRAWRDELGALGLTDDDVLITGHVDDATLDALYAEAALFVFSSRYEGFGLPALEAAVAGAPVITSDVSSLPEVIEHELAHVPIDDVETLARRMTLILTDTDARADLAQASRRAAERHTWVAVAARTLDAYWATARRASRPKRAPARNDEAERMRLALVGPYPPSKSGIATWTARLVEALAPQTDVDVFREGDVELPGREHHERGRRFPIEAFGRVIGANEYDAPIYTIGNGFHHRHALEAALHTPGIVWLHEVQLAGLYLTRAGLFHPGIEPAPIDIERARQVMADAVVRLHPGATPLGDDDWWRTEAYDERGYSFLTEVVRSARAVIVSTEMAASAVHRVAPEGATVHVMPLPFPEREHSSGPATNGSDGGERWIIALGWVDPIKQPDVLVRAFARVGATHPDARLAFVGELAPSTRADLDALARELGVTRAITYTGFVSAEEYDRSLARADIAVQLRATSRGEASAALHDTLAAGIATITNIPTAAELPPDVLVSLSGATGATLEEQLASQLDHLLADDGVRGAISTAARAHADQWRFRDLANRLLDIVAATPRPNASWSVE